MLTLVCPHCFRIHHPEPANAGMYLKCGGCGNFVKIEAPANLPEVSRHAVISGQTHPVPYQMKSSKSRILLIVILLAIAAYLLFRTPGKESPPSETTSTAPIPPPAPLPTVTPHPNGYQLIKPSSLSGRGTLTLNNGTEYDAVVNVLSGEKIKGSIYISTGQTVTLDHIANGTYIVRVANGTAWSDFAHDFNDPAGYFEFPHPYTFSEIHRDDGIEYDQITLTLHAVPGGNVVKVPITRTVFWPPDQ